MSDAKLRAEPSCGVAESRISVSDRVASSRARRARRDTPDSPARAATSWGILVNDDHVPPGVFQVIAILQVALERVDGDDAAVEVVERVVIGRDAVAHPRQANGIEPHQRDGKAAPPLFLERVSMAFCVTTRMRSPRPRWISSVASTPASSVLPRPTASAIRMRARGWRRACKAGSQLVRHQVHHPAMAQVDAVVIGQGAAALAFQVQERGVVGRAGVGHEPGGSGVEHLDMVFECGQEQRLLAAHQIGNTVTGEQPARRRWKGPRGGSAILHHG